MADSLTRERLEELITSNPNVNGTGWINADRQGHYKTYRFEVRGVTYEIDWACSYSILKCGEMRIPFDDLTVKGTWPTGFRYNLQFPPVSRRRPEEKGAGCGKRRIVRDGQADSI